MEDADWVDDAPSSHDLLEDSPPLNTQARYEEFEDRSPQKSIAAAADTPAQTPAGPTSPGENAHPNFVPDSTSRVDRHGQSALAEVARGEGQTSPIEAANEGTHEEGSLSGVCPICLQPVDGEAYLDPCFHRFCFTCIVRWSRTGVRVDTPPLCPVCKSPFFAIIHDFRGTQFKRYDVLGGVNSAQFQLSDRHIARRGVYEKEEQTPGIGCKGLGSFGRGFGQGFGGFGQGRWLRCWVQRELQALLEEEDVEIMALHIVGSVELLAEQRKQKQKFGANVRPLLGDETDEEGGQEGLVRSLKKPPPQEKKLVFGIGKTSLVLSKAGLARRKARKGINGSVRLGPPPETIVKLITGVGKMGKDKEKREIGTRKVSEWLGGSVSAGAKQGAAEGEHTPGADTTIEKTENETKGGLVAAGEQVGGQQTERQADEGTDGQMTGLSKHGGEENGNPEGVEAANSEGGENGLAADGLSGHRSQTASVNKSSGEANEGADLEGALLTLAKKGVPAEGVNGQSKEPSEDDKEWLRVVAAAAKPFLFEKADRFAAELMAFLCSGLDIARYDAATLPPPPGAILSDEAQSDGEQQLALSERPSEDIADLKRAIEDENEGDYFVEGGVWVERPRKKKRGGSAVEYGSLWTAAKEDLDALPRAEDGGISGCEAAPLEKEKRRKKRREDGESGAERRKKQKHGEKAPDDNEFEQRQHRKRHRRRDRHRRHRRERADSVDKSDSSLERAVHAYRKKLRRRRKDGRRLSDGLPLSSTDDEAESWVDWRKRMKKLYRFCKTEMEEASSDDSSWGDENARKDRGGEANRRAENGKERERGGTGFSGERASRVSHDREAGRGFENGGVRLRRADERRHTERPWGPEAAKGGVSNRRADVSNRRDDVSNLRGDVSNLRDDVRRGDVSEHDGARVSDEPKRRGGLKRSSAVGSEGMDRTSDGSGKKRARVRWVDEEPAGGLDPRANVRPERAEDVEGWAEEESRSKRTHRFEDPEGAENPRVFSRGVERVADAVPPERVASLEVERAAWVDEDRWCGGEEIERYDEGLVGWDGGLSSFEGVGGGHRRVVQGLDELDDELGAEQNREATRESGGQAFVTDPLEREAGFEDSHVELREAEPRKRPRARAHKAKSKGQSASGGTRTHEQSGRESEEVPRLEPLETIPVDVWRSEERRSRVVSLGRREAHRLEGAESIAERVAATEDLETGHGAESSMGAKSRKSPRLASERGGAHWAKPQVGELADLGVTGPTGQETWPVEENVVGGVLQEGSGERQVRPRVLLIPQEGGRRGLNRAGRVFFSRAMVELKEQQEDILREVPTGWSQKLSAGKRRQRQSSGRKKVPGGGLEEAVLGDQHQQLMPVGAQDYPPPGSQQTVPAGVSQEGSRGSQLPVPAEGPVSKGAGKDKASKPGAALQKTVVPPKRAPVKVTVPGEGALANRMQTPRPVTGKRPAGANAAGAVLKDRRLSAPISSPRTTVGPKPLISKVQQPTRLIAPVPRPGVKTPNGIAAQLKLVRPGQTKPILKGGAILRPKVTPPSLFKPRVTRAALVSPTNRTPPGVSPKFPRKLQWVRPPNTPAAGHQPADVRKPPGAKAHQSVQKRMPPARPTKIQKQAPPNAVGRQPLGEPATSSGVQKPSEAIRIADAQKRTVLGQPPNAAKQAQLTTIVGKPLGAAVESDVRKPPLATATAAAQQRTTPTLSPTTVQKQAPVTAGVRKPLDAATSAGVRKPAAVSATASAALASKGRPVSAPKLAPPKPKALGGVISKSPPANVPKLAAPKPGPLPKPPPNGVSKPQATLLQRAPTGPPIRHMAVRTPSGFPGKSLTLARPRSNKWQRGISAPQPARPVAVSPRGKSLQWVRKETQPSTGVTPKAPAGSTPGTGSKAAPAAKPPVGKASVVTGGVKPAARKVDFGRKQGAGVPGGAKIVDKKVILLEAKQAKDGKEGSKGLPAKG